MRIPNINCIHFTKKGSCLKKPEILGSFSPQCILINCPNEKCDIQTKYSRATARRPMTELSIKELKEDIKKLEESIETIHNLIEIKKYTIKLLKNTT